MAGFRRVKQKALERIGYSQRTFEAEEVQQAAVKVKIMKNNIRKVAERCKQYQSRSNKIVGDLQDLTAALYNFSLLTMDTPDNRIEKALKTFSSVETKLANLHGSMEKAINQLLLLPMQQLVDIDVAVLEQVRVAEKKARLNYDAQMAKLRSAQKGSMWTKVQEQEEQVQKAKEEYELFAASFMAKVNGSGGNTRIKMLGILRMYLIALRAFFAEGYVILNEVNSFLNDLDSVIKDNYHDMLDDIVVGTT